MFLARNNHGRQPNRRATAKSRGRMLLVALTIVRRTTALLPTPHLEAMPTHRFDFVRGRGGEDVRRAPAVWMPLDTT